MMPRRMFRSVQTFCERQIYWTFPLFHIMALSFVFDACVHHVLLVNCDIANAPYIWENFSMSLICFMFRNAYLKKIKKMCTVGLSCYYFHPHTFRSWVQIQSNYALILVMLYAFFRTTDAKYVIFLFVWRKLLIGSATACSKDVGLRDVYFTSAMQERCRKYIRIFYFRDVAKISQNMLYLSNAVMTLFLTLFQRRTNASQDMLYPRDATKSS